MSDTGMEYPGRTVNAYIRGYRFSMDTNRKITKAMYYSVGYLAGRTDGLNRITLQTLITGQPHEKHKDYKD